MSAGRPSRSILCGGFFFHTLERLSAAGGAPVECDIADLELRLFREAFGPLIPMLLATFGQEQLETRDDLNNLALALQWLI